MSEADGAIEAAYLLGNSNVKSSKRSIQADNIILELNKTEGNLNTLKSAENSERIDEQLRNIVDARRKAVGLKNACKFIDDEESSTSAGNNPSGLYVKRTSLKTFNGDPKNWTTWYESIRVGVLENSSFDDTGRALKIQELAIDDAAQTIKGVSAIAANLPSMLSKLAKRHGNPAKIIQGLKNDLDAVVEVGSIEPSPEEDRRKFDRMTSLIAGLQHAGHTADDRTMIQHIMKRISRMSGILTFYKLGITSQTADLKLSDFTPALDEMITMLEIVDTFKGQQPPDESGPIVTTLMNKARNAPRCKGAPNPGPRPIKKEKSSAESKTADNCKFCNGSHPTRLCTVYKTLSTRKNRLMTLGRCFKCFKHGHLASKCPAKNLVCNVCQVADHVGPLCPTLCEKDEGEYLTFLQTFYCMIEGAHGKRVLAKGILDQGSNTSYMLEKLIEILELDSHPKTDLRVQTYGTENISTVQSRKATVTIFGKDESFVKCTLNSCPCLTGAGRLKPPPGFAAATLPNDRCYADPDLFTSHQRILEVLIGSDQYHCFVRERNTFRLSPSLVLYDTIFGWVPNGSVDFSTSLTAESTILPLKKILHATASTSNQLDRLESAVENLWSLDLLGLRKDENDPNEAQVLNYFRNTTKRENGRFVVNFPWKRDRRILQSHQRMCEARLRSLIKNYSPDVLFECNRIIQEQEIKGIIERAPVGSPYTIHYIPFKPVEHNGKWRIVYDASAKTKSGPSLNECLHAGPPLTKNAVGMLLNFRLREKGLEADIEKAYLMVGLNIIDRDVVRFIWVADPSKPLEGANIIRYRFTRTPFGVNSSPYLLNMVLQELLSEDSENWCYRVARDKFYVDNLLLSVDTTDEIVSLYKALTSKLAEANFNLRDWVSNDQDAIAQIPSYHQGDNSGIVPVLGMNWHITDDLLRYKFEEETMPDVGSMKSVLSNLATAYDPLGLVAPCLLSLKLLVQECHKLGLNWQEPIPDNMISRYTKALEERNKLKTLSIPIYLWNGPMHNAIYDLHVFCDASEKAYGCAVYLVRSSNDNPDLNKSVLVYSKSRVAPSKPKRTIPELELMGVVTGKRSLAFVKAQFDISIHSTTLWTDATTILHWLHSIQEKGVFVRNRINEIKQTPSVQVRYVPTSENPADIVSRGASAESLNASELWWKAPQWLSSLRSWPEAPEAIQPYYTSLLTTTCPIEDNILSRPIFGWCSKTNQYRNYLLEERWSDWNKYINLFQIVLKLLFKVKKITSIGEQSDYAERVLIRLIQYKYFPHDLNKIQSKTQLNLFISDGITRHRSRLDPSDFPYDTACPALLPRPHFGPGCKQKGSPLILTLFRHLHIQNCHIGVSHLLAKIREKYWVDKARSLVKSLIHRCAVCRRWLGGAYQRPQMNPLPSVRIQPVIPFLNTGLDYFGPLMVTLKLPNPLTSVTGQKYRITDSCGQEIFPTPAHQRDNVIIPQQPIRVLKKVHVCLFTCLVTRAVHLEIAEDLSADQFLLALDRFCNTRITPHMIVSDNATNFKYVQPFVGPQVTWQEHKMNTYFRDHQIDWYYIPSYSPWSGGVYERLVGVVKKSLKFAIGKSLVDQMVLDTALRRVANIVNSRPLTYTSSDEAIQPLTPNHFLKPAVVQSGNLIEIYHENVPSKKDNLLLGWWHVQGLVENYRRAFNTLYFSSLRDVQVQHHRHPRGSLPIRPSVGDVVLVQEPSLPRTAWPIALVNSVSDRTADITITKQYYGVPLPTGPAQVMFRKKIETRTFDKLYPLETAYDGGPAITAPSFDDHTYSMCP